MSQTIAFGSAARTATPAPLVLDTVVGTALVVVVDVTAIVTAPSITVAIDGIDAASGQVWNILTSTPITAVTGATPRVLKVGRGLTAAANLVANDLVPDKVRISVSHANGNSITYGVGVHVLD